MGFQKIERVVKSYTEIRNAIDSWFQPMYQKAVSLSEVVGGAEERPLVCSTQRNRGNYLAESAAQYWKRRVAVPFLDVIFPELKSRFGKGKREEYGGGALRGTQYSNTIRKIGKYRNTVSKMHEIPIPHS